MVDKERLMRRLLATFVDEVDDQVRAVRALLDEGHEGADAAAAIFRAMHSLKGAARSVNQPELERLCHLLEDRLADSVIDPALAALLRDATDALTAAAGRLRSSGPSADLRDLVAPFLGAHTPPPAPLAAAPARVVIPPPPPPSARARRPRGAEAARSPEVPRRIAARPAATTTRLSAGTLDSLVADSGEVVTVERRLERVQAEMAALDEILGGLAGQVRDLVVTTGRMARDEPTAVAARRLGKEARRAQRALSRVLAGFAENHRRLASMALVLHDRLLALRMVPFALACEGLETVLADLARTTGREVTLRIEGAGVEVDRGVLESLQDALRHLVRNAVAHGIEQPEARLAAGKPARALVTVAAVLRGGMVEVRVSDDGRGLDRAAIRSRLAARGFEGEMTDEVIDNVIFQPGFTTRDEVGALSGRGVGLDAVRDRVTTLNGSILVHSIEGKGTTFVVSVPVTMSRVEALLVRALRDQAVFAIAMSAVERVVRVGDAALEGLRVLPLAELVSPSADASVGSLALVVRGAGQAVAFVVAEVVGAATLVLQSLGPRLRRTPLVTAASHLADGGIAPVLDADGLVRVGLGLPGLPETAPVPIAVKHRILVAEDSATTRTLVRTLLEGAGYEVVTARDGQEAWDLVQGDAFDVVVSDVDMPRLDGLELTARIRASEHPLPVVLLTSRAQAEDVERGLRAGARAYLPKASFERATLLEALARLL